MSERPGTIVNEIIVELPARHDPLQRRKHPEMNHYVALLMDLLKLDANKELH